MNTYDTKRRRPLALQMATAVREPKIEGRYSEATQTWSDRKFAQLAAKKHCEAR